MAVALRLTTTSGSAGRFLFHSRICCSSSRLEKGKKGICPVCGLRWVRGRNRGAREQNAGRAWRSEPRGQRTPAGRPWANEAQTKTTRHTEAVVSARRRRRAVRAAPKIVFEIWILKAHISRPAGAPRRSVGQGPLAFSRRTWGGCHDVGGGGSRRRRKGRVPRRCLRPPRAAMRRRGPAGDGVAPTIARDLPRGQGLAARLARSPSRAPCPALPPGSPRTRLGGTQGRQGLRHPNESRPFTGGVTKSRNTGPQRAEGRP